MPSKPLNVSNGPLGFGSRAQTSDVKSRITSEQKSYSPKKQVQKIKTWE